MILYYYTNYYMKGYVLKLNYHYKYDKDLFIHSFIIKERRKKKNQLFKLFE